MGNPFSCSPRLWISDHRVPRNLLLLALLFLFACATPEPPARDPRPNLLLISLDTLRADRLGSYGYERDTSPFLDELARRGVRFEHAFVNTHGTPPSHATLFTSTYQQTHRVSIDVMARNPDHRVPESLRLLPEILRDAGYATVAVTGGGYMSESFGFDQGFDVFHSLPVDVERGARRFSREVRKLLGHGRPVFAFFHTYEIHSPYDPPTQHRRRFGQYRSDFDPTSRNLRKFRRRVHELSAEDMGRIQAFYDGGIRYTDDTLRELFDELEEAGFFDRHLAVITSDHGEEFGEHKRLLHPATLFEELLRVPLIVTGTGVEPRVENRLVSTVDVAPTLYARAGIEPPANAEGRDLLTSPLAEPEAEEPAIFAQYGDLVYGVRTERYKLVAHERRRQTALYDLEQDPGEQRNVAAERPEVVERLSRRLEEWRSRVDAGAEEESKAPAEIDEEMRRRLEALGYVN